MSLTGPRDIPDLNEDMQEYMEGPEDAIVKGNVFSSILIKPAYSC
jgi:hypothetical protein